MAKFQKGFLIVANWKMNKTAKEAVDFAKELINVVDKETAVNIALCVPFTALGALAPICVGSNIALGAQNMNSEPSGAFTGEISAQMLCEFFVTYVIIGHSERRIIFYEDNALINKKVKAALNANFCPILCVGETIEERQAGKTLKIIGQQIEGGLKDLPREKIENLVIAYEPVWAIGTGKTATAQMAQEVHAAIRGMLKKQLGSIGNKIRIIYGGSMKPDNAEELLMQPDIDGGLIGGASLVLQSFVEIIELAQKVAEHNNAYY